MFWKHFPTLLTKCFPSQTGTISLSLYNRRLQFAFFVVFYVFFFLFFFSCQEQTPGDFFLNALIFLSKSKAKQKTHQQTFAERCTMRSQQLIVHIKLEKTASCPLSICGVEFKKMTMITNYTFNSPVFTQETQLHNSFCVLIR